MVDLVKLHIRSGKGGDGRISFFSNRRTLKGGPDGGDGGDGGSVIATATPHENTLRHFAGVAKISGDNGHMGGATNMHGKDAQDIRILLPVGTRIWRIEDTYIPNVPKRMYRNDRDLGRVERPIERRASSLIQQVDGVFQLIDDPSVQSVQADALVARKELQLGEVTTLKVGEEEVRVRLVGDLTQEGQEVVIARGGRGGRGNETYKSSRNTTPIEAQTGEGAEEADYIFELQLLADVGLVGLPNAGKSTLLSVLTKATPKIANYPFTTLEPNLGVMTIDAAHQEDRRSLVIADIPGLIEGASEGKGLGHEFLRHVSRCKLLVFLLALEDAITLQLQENPTGFAEELLHQYETLEQELSTYAAEHSLTEEMEGKQRLLLLSKADLVDEEVRNQIQQEFKDKKLTVQWISSATGEGLAEFKNILVQKVF